MLDPYTVGCTKSGRKEKGDIGGERFGVFLFKKEKVWGRACLSYTSFCDILYDIPIRRAMAGTKCILRSIHNGIRKRLSPASDEEGAP